jgi:hypothetical protein
VSTDDLPDFLTADDLEALAITVEDIRRLDPQPVEYVALGDRPCWRRDDLAELLEGRNR